MKIQKLLKPLENSLDPFHEIPSKKLKQFISDYLKYGVKPIIEIDTEGLSAVEIEELSVAVYIISRAYCEPDKATQELCFRNLEMILFWFQKHKKLRAYKFPVFNVLIQSIAMAPDIPLIEKNVMLSLFSKSFLSGLSEFNQLINIAEKAYTFSLAVISEKTRDNPSVLSTICSEHMVTSWNGYIISQSEALKLFEDMLLNMETYYASQWRVLAKKTLREAGLSTGCIGFLDRLEYICSEIDKASISADKKVADDVFSIKLDDIQLIKKLPPEKQMVIDYLFSIDNIECTNDFKRLVLFSIASIKKASITCSDKLSEHGKYKITNNETNNIDTYYCETVLMQEGINPSIFDATFTKEFKRIHSLHIKAFNQNIIELEKSLLKHSING